MDSENRLRHELTELNLLVRGLAEVPTFPAELLELISGKVDLISRLVPPSNLSVEQQVVPELKTIVVEPTKQFHEPMEQKHQTDITRSLTLNDRFRFQREFFQNDSHKMSEIFSVINKKQSLEDALDYFRDVCTVDEASDCFQDFRLMLQLHFTSLQNTSQSV